VFESPKQRTTRSLTPATLQRQEALPTRFQPARLQLPLLDPHFASEIQTAYAKALIVDRQALREAQIAGDVLGAYRVLTNAYETDVRPLLIAFRKASGLPIEPVASFREPGTVSVSHRSASDRLAHQRCSRESKRLLSDFSLNQALRSRLTQ
jgi:hypothetical protein